MEVHGQEVLVVPQLVTGCKIWHLRPEGSFYPKSAWLTAVDALPAGSMVSACCPFFLRHTYSDLYICSWLLVESQDASPFVQPCIK